MKKEELLKYIENPGMLYQGHLPAIEEMIEVFPFCQTFHLLKAKALHNTGSSSFDKSLKTAAIYAGNRRSLYYLIHKTPKQVAVEEETEALVSAIETPENYQEPVIVDEVGVAEEVEQQIYEEEKEERISEVQVYLEEEEVISAEEEIDIPEEVQELESQEILVSEETVISESVSETDTEELEIISEDETTPIILNEEIPIYTEDIQASDLLEEETEEIAQPAFSFQDWLKKTSGVEEEIKEKKILIRLDTSESIKPLIEDAIGELIVSNMFNEGYLIQADEKISLGKDNKDSIIENFIHSDHPKVIKINKEELKNSSENKAKKSSDDHDVPVSETLAQIFIKQKLYSKAISAYEKLSLKFPEKKIYFASLIEGIKKEIN